MSIQPATPGAEDAALHGPMRLIASLALGGAAFMNVLDLTITNVSIPAISGDLGASVTQGTWTITFFAIANAIMVPLTGWLAERIGQVRLFVLSTLGFTLFSLLCGLARSMEMLIFLRALQGACAGPMMPLTQSLLLHIHPPRGASRALVLGTLPAMLGPVLGPTFGGYITEAYSWPWIFFINIPFGLLASWLVWSLLHKHDTPRQRRPVDYIGLALLVVWVGSLQLMLDLGREQDWFESGTITLLGVIALMGFGLFLAWEIYEPHPVVDLKLFRRSNFVFGVSVSAFGASVYMSGVVLISLWMQQTLGFRAILAGMMNAPPGFISLFLVPLGAKLFPRLGPYVLLICSFTFMAIGNAMRAGFTADISPMTIVAAQVVLGVGMSQLLFPATNMILRGLQPAQISAATSLSNFARLLLNAAFISCATTLWDYRSSFHHARLTEGIAALNPVANGYADQAASLGLGGMQLLALEERQIANQSATMAIADFFHLSSLIFWGTAAVILATWFYARKRPNSGLAVHR